MGAPTPRPPRSEAGGRSTRCPPWASRCSPWAPLWCPRRRRSTVGPSPSSQARNSSNRAGTCMCFRRRTRARRCRSPSSPGSTPGASAARCTASGRAPRLPPRCRRNSWGHSPTSSAAPSPCSSPRSCKCSAPCSTGSTCPTPTAGSTRGGSGRRSRTTPRPTARDPASDSAAALGRGLALDSRRPPSRRTSSSSGPNPNSRAAPP
mmetsp:Transcript_29867/g.85903  ORF Transcript_29867/g.85903 Transcript_29867/m.85903 type:complete len:206 (-) Transcript_29867:519-1136(-)